jgi:hypothetical protein
VDAFIWTVRSRALICYLSIIFLPSYSPLSLRRDLFPNVVVHSSKGVLLDRSIVRSFGAADSSAS